MGHSVAQLYHSFVDKKALVRVFDYKARAPGGNTLKQQLGIWIPVRISDARITYGREQILIQPLHGKGSTWIDVGERVQIVDEWPEESDATNETPQPDEPSGTD